VSPFFESRIEVVLFLIKICIAYMQFEGIDTDEWTFSTSVKGQVTNTRWVYHISDASPRFLSRKNRPARLDGKIHTTMLRPPTLALQSVGEGGNISGRRRAELGETRNKHKT
jgi:hypothetical protein